MNPLNEWSARRRGRYLHSKQQSQDPNIHALSGIQTRDQAIEPLQTYALDHKTKETGYIKLTPQHMSVSFQAGYSASRRESTL